MGNAQKLESLAAAGVTIIDRPSTFIDDEVMVGSGTTIHPGVTLQGRTSIGSGCAIQSWVRIADSHIGDRVIVDNFCVIVEARIASESKVGPFAHLRPGTDVKEGARIGNFVELKNTEFGAGSKASHLSYLGDATIGSRVNIGAGTITCNYDGARKHRTTIEDGVFIGSDSQLIAPVRVAAGSYVAAGSTITDDVPPGALGIARGRQRNVEGWVERKKRTGKGE